MTVKLDGFRAAMRAALDGPEKKDVEWTKFGHDFNVKKVDVKRNGDTIEIDGQVANESQRIAISKQLEALQWNQ